VVSAAGEEQEQNKHESKDKVDGMPMFITGMFCISHDLPCLYQWPFDIRKSLFSVYLCRLSRADFFSSALLPRHND